MEKSRSIHNINNKFPENLFGSNGVTHPFMYMRMPTHTEQEQRFFKPKTET
jgi:hypothetical protein